MLHDETSLKCVQEKEDLGCDFAGISKWFKRFRSAYCNGE